MSSDLEILHDFLKNPISLDLDKLKYGRDSASLTTDSGREIKLPIFDANDIFQKVRFHFFPGIANDSVLIRFHSKLENFHSKLEKFHNILENFHSKLEKFDSKLGKFHNKLR